MKRIAILALALLLPTWSARAVAEDKNGVEVRAVAEVEVKVKDEKTGKEETKRVPAAKVPPGVAVIYTLHADNKGSKPAEDVVVTDPIPEHMDYVDGSATSQGARLTFSADGGKTWTARDKAMVKGKDGAMRVATAQEITHLRWQFEKPIAPGESRAVEFRARVE
jgi:uncharacterized repeat protein (TIGR01451 family)